MLPHWWGMETWQVRCDKQEDIFQVQMILAQVGLERSHLVKVGNDQKV